MIAALSAWHVQHDAAAAALEPVDALPAHVLVEAFSLLTRLPSGLAVPPTLAADILGRRFDRPPLRLDEPARRDLLRTLAGAGVLGGASYDGLVALEARAHAQTLLTVDERAQMTYRRLGVEFDVIGT